MRFSINLGRSTASGAGCESKDVSKGYKGLCRGLAVEVPLKRSLSQPKIFELSRVGAATKTNRFIVILLSLLPSPSQMNEPYCLPYEGENISNVHQLNETAEEVFPLELVSRSRQCWAVAMLVLDGFLLFLMPCSCLPILFPWSSIKKLPVNMSVVTLMEHRSGSIRSRELV